MSRRNAWGMGAWVVSLVLSGCATTHIVRTPAQAVVDGVKPKYGPEATLLSQSHEYIKSSDAPDYWVISPYYVPQQNDSSCSIASVTMIVNAARSGQKLTADDELARQSSLLEKVGDEEWIKAVSDGGHGVVLDQLKTLTEKSLSAYGLQAKVEAVHVDSASEDAAKALHQALLENEASSKNFIIINFIQGVFTGDAQIGHIAPIAAYDSKRKQVLVMDPDRQWYEPYWVSEETLLAGIATQDKSSGKSRGYLKIQINP